MVLVRVAADIIVYALSFTIFVESISERESDAHTSIGISGNYIFSPTQSHSG